MKVSCENTDCVRCQNGTCTLESVSITKDKICNGFIKREPVKLKKCPFCGSVPVINRLHKRNEFSVESDIYTYEVKCNVCGCTLDYEKNNTEHMSEAESMQNAVNAWNNRSVEHDMSALDYKTITEYLEKLYNERPDKKNIYGVGISDDAFIYYAIQYLLGSDWYVSDHLGRSQINEIALIEILEKYSKQYRKEIVVNKYARGNRK